MNAQLLIDAIVRQTTILIAQLATSGGLRAPLANIANQVFLELTNELEAQGVSRRVSADMFGMALRAYLRKIQRLRESSTDGGKTVWEAVYDYVRTRDVVTRRQVIEHFARDDEGVVRGALHDLADSGLVFSTGVGSAAVFRAATDDELGKMRQLRERPIDELLWAFIYREGLLTRPQMAKQVSVPAEALDAALARLAGGGRIEPQHASGETLWVARRFALPLDSSLGWEAAIFDHFQALVKTICQKLEQAPEARANDVIGGSTYTYEVWAGHPHEREAMGVLAGFRSKQGELRDAISHYNSSTEMPDKRTRVTVYAGQCVVQEEES